MYLHNKNPVKSTSSSANLPKNAPRLSVLGMARPDAPPELGLALSQARAVRVRSHLLGLLANCPAWEDEHAIDGGVRHL